jgi:hypothetical protein
MQEVKELYGGYGRITILNGVSLSIPQGIYHDRHRTQRCW